MTPPFSQTLKRQAETALTDARFDFIAKYHAVSDLRRLASQEVGLLDEKTLAALTHLLQSKDYSHLRQSYFLFREAAKVLRTMAIGPRGNGLRSKALASLHHLLRTTTRHAHRGTAEALGSLPVDVAGPHQSDWRPKGCPSTTWNRLMASKGLDAVGAPRYIGRSLVVETAPTGYLLVVKLAKSGDRSADLANEVRWMERLRPANTQYGCRFHIPAPLRIDGRPVCCLKRLPLPPPATVAPHPDGWAIAYLAHRDYFVYPNDPGVDGRAATEILGRCAFLLGRLAGDGIIHNAPIPLFHNRTQRLRREDQGRYQWFRGGRLDQWLDSCAFPNFGLSGLRDFEHLESFDGDHRSLYRHMGSHLLSLLLVAGSWFRRQDEARAGLGQDGKPIDVRHRFDQKLLTTMVKEIFGNYYNGFTGQAAPALPLDKDRLVVRMIEEMGVDRHMTELLRRADQKRLSDSQFFAFLAEKGYRADERKTVVRGEKDIRLVSGPHLGDFNRQISLPELIEGVAAMAAVCVAGRYASRNHRALGGSGLR